MDVTWIDKNSFTSPKREGVRIDLKLDFALQKQKELGFDMPVGVQHLLSARQFNPVGGQRKQIVSVNAVLLQKPLRRFVHNSPPCTDEHHNSAINKLYYISFTLS
ncbi:hypothetical protein D3C81_780830 [compost metagenome]